MSRSPSGPVQPSELLENLDQARLSLALRQWDYYQNAAAGSWPAVFDSTGSTCSNFPNAASRIFQEPMTSLNPAFTVGDQVSEILRRHAGVKRRVANERALKALERVGIPNAARRMASYPHEFSGGMRQRVMIAMAMACEPSVLIADEPTTALDVTIQAQVLDLLKEMVKDRGIGLVFVTHDLGVVADICDNVAVMYAGQIVATSGVDELFHRPAHPYAEGLMVAMPQADTGSGELITIPGEAVSPGRAPSGCRFHPRCPYAKEACKTGEPELRVLSAGRATRCIRYEELTLRGPA
jgi:peptide/nickel transport system ATP-binding protein